MAQGTRRPWKDEDNTTLISYWGVVGSVALIAIMMQRTLSSVQTQASRLGLPPRDESRDRHRRRWLPEDDAQLDALLAKHVRKDGKILIQAVADGVSRSVDAVVARIISRHGENSDIMNRLVAPPAPVVPKSSALVASSAAKTANAPASNKNGGKVKNCLRCRKLFMSAGNHNWICMPCKRSDDWQSDWP